jgi:hypothetical protein
MLGDGFGALERLAAFTTTPKRSRLNGNVRYGSLADLRSLMRSVRFPPKADMLSVGIDVCKVPKADMDKFARESSNHCLPANH